MTETTGTPESTQEGANATASGTPAATPEGGNAGLTAEQVQEYERLKSEKGQWLAEKTNYEEAKRRLAEQEAMGQQQPPTGYDPAVQQAEELRRSYEDLAARDPDAARLLSAVAQTTQAQLQQTQAQLRWYRELDAIPASDRPEVEARAKKLNVMPSWAKKDLDSERYVQKEKDLETERQRLQAERDRIARGVVSTTTAPSPPARGSGDEITAEEYAKACERAERGDTEARKLLARCDDGLVRVRSG